jgi:hypothetical protein
MKTSGEINVSHLQMMKCNKLKKLRERSDKFKEIVNFREEYRLKKKNFVDTFQKFSTFNEYYSSKSEEIQKLGIESEEYQKYNKVIEYYSSFDKNQKKLNMVAYLPLITNFYLKLHNLTCYQYTKDEIYNMKITEVIKNTKGKLTLEELREFLILWNENTSEIQAQVCNANEMFFNELKEDSEFYKFLNYGDDKGITKWIEEVSQVHNLFTEENSIHLEYLTDREEYSILSPYIENLISKIIQCNKQVLMDGIIHYDYDWEFINTIMVDKLQKFRLKFITSNIFKFKEKLEIPSEIVSNKEHEIKELSQNEIIYRLLQWLEKNEKNDSYRFPRLENIYTSISQKSQSEILEICSFLEKFVQFLDITKDKSKTIIEIIKRHQLKESKKYCKNIEKIEYCEVIHVPRIIQICRDAYFEAGLVFSLVNLNLNEKIPKEIEIILEELQKEVLRNTPQWKNNHEKMKLFADILISPKFTDSFYLSNNQHDSLVERLNATKLKNFIPASMKEWLPEEITVEMYENYMKFIHRTVGNIHLKLISTPKNTWYKEKVPENYIAQQNLSNETPVPQKLNSMNTLANSILGSKSVKHLQENFRQSKTFDIVNKTEEETIDSDVFQAETMVSVRKSRKRDVEPFTENEDLKRKREEEEDLKEKKQKVEENAKRKKEEEDGSQKKKQKIEIPTMPSVDAVIIQESKTSQEIKSEIQIPKSISEWFKEMKISDSDIELYVVSFEDEGFDDIEQILFSLTEKEVKELLDASKVKKGHQLKIIKGIQKFNPSFK